MSILLCSLILQANYFARDVFTIRRYQRMINQLSENKEDLEINLARSSSMENIEDFLKSQNFQKVNKVKYIKVLEASVARQR
jgi:hypothetical protein